MMKTFLQHLLETRDGDYEGAPPILPMTDEELEKYYQEYRKDKNKSKRKPTSSK